MGGRGVLIRVWVLDRGSGLGFGLGAHKGGRVKQVPFVKVAFKPRDGAFFELAKFDIYHVERNLMSNYYEIQHLC